MDLVEDERRTQVFSERINELITRSLPLEITGFATSIWDESLYRAWSSIVHSLVPNVRLLESHLQNFATICEADEVVLFERTTFLVISHSTRIENRDAHRFEKI
ncbi:1357_t:CDS:2, partial [Acaulospora colombiana]